jgi:ergothioneine biosynthesis protein EgtC
MCRFALYLGSPILVSSLVTKPEHSIVHQSFEAREREGPLNGDGFGIAWYAPDIAPEPALFRDVSPAWSNANLTSLARLTRTPCFLAHVRAATPGLPVSPLNCHPFVRGRLAFMHNGEIGGFRQIVRLLCDVLTDDAYHGIQGSTDSEHLFALIAQLHDERRDDDPLERMAGAVFEAIERLECLRIAAGVTECTSLNIVLTDGRRAVVTRYISHDPDRVNSLYVCGARRRGRDEDSWFVVPTAADHEAVLVASEPLGRDPGWQRVAPNHALLIGEDLAVVSRPIAAAVPAPAGS